MKIRRHTVEKRMLIGGTVVNFASLIVLLLYDVNYNHVVKAFNYNVLILSSLTVLAGTLHFMYNHPHTVIVGDYIVIVGLFRKIIIDLKTVNYVNWIGTRQKTKAVEITIADSGKISIRLRSLDPVDTMRVIDAICRGVALEKQQGVLIR